MVHYFNFYALAYGFFLISYFVPNGFFYWLFWKHKRDHWAAHRIQKDRDPKPGQIAREIRSSLLSLGWYAAIATFVFYCYRHGQCSLTTEPVSLTYHLLSVVALMLLHDTYFYWVHRLEHWPPVFRAIHKKHHDSLAPTPWAAYSFHWGEAILQCPLWVLCFTIPAHPLAAFFVLFLQNIYDTFGHLGYEFFPSWILRNQWICAVQATPTHHDAHHRYFQGNYSHYFNVWDKLMGTELKHYREMCENAYVVGGHDQESHPPVGKAAPARVGTVSGTGAAADVRFPAVPANFAGSHLRSVESSSRIASAVE